MFPWNIAKSAEAMFSRWAVKRVCKFVLKKKLGQFILGDIDLDQLDVQLREGTIQLSDLALNVDCLNEKVRLILLFFRNKQSSLIISMGMNTRIFIFYFCLSLFVFINEKNGRFLPVKVIRVILTH